MTATVTIFEDGSGGWRYHVSWPSSDETEQGALDPMTAAEAVEVLRERYAPCVVRG